MVLKQTLGCVPKVLALVFFYKERVLAASKMLGIHTVFPALFSLQSLPPCEKSRHPDFRDTPCPEKNAEGAWTGPPAGGGAGVPAARFCLTGTDGMG